MKAARKDVVVINNSDYPIWVKLGKGEEPIEIKPKSYSRFSAIDGIAAPHLRKGMVYKVIGEKKIVINIPGKVELMVRNDGIIEYPSNWIMKEGQKRLGDWRDSDWVKKHPDWKPLWLLSILPPITWFTVEIIKKRKSLSP